MTSAFITLLLYILEKNRNITEPKKQHFAPIHLISAHVFIAPTVDILQAVRIARGAVNSQRMPLSAETRCNPEQEYYHL